MNFDLGELIRVIAENCPNEAVGIFIGTYGVFIVALLMVVILLIRFAKKTSLKGSATDSDIAELKSALGIVTNQASTIAVDNANVTNSIKDEIRANNDTTMQLLIAMALASGMNYTDITNVISKASNIYNASESQYNALMNEAKAKVEEENKKAQEEAETKAQVNEDLASIKIV
jgi:hypothetical protein